MTPLAVLSAVAFLIAAVALVRARRLARRLDQVVESYWELRYDYGQLRAQVDRLQGKPEPDSSPGGAAATGSTAFVPLSSIRRT